MKPETINFNQFSIAAVIPACLGRERNRNVDGINKWIDYAGRGVPAPTGTVMFPTLSVILAIQILLSAIEIDLQSVPKAPLSESLAE